MKADIWSLGIAFYVKATGSFPWMHSKGEITEQIISGKINFPSNVSTPVAKIIKQMLEIDPTKRTTSEQLLSNDNFACIKMFSNPLTPDTKDKELYKEGKLPIKINKSNSTNKYINLLTNIIDTENV